MWTGFGMSVNTYFVPLQEKVGADKVIEMSKRLGIQYRNTKDKEITSRDRSRGFGPFTIGVTDTVPLELANAYATVAADGKYCQPMPVLTIYSNKGEKLTDVTKPRCNQAVKPEVARAAADAARCPIRDGGGLGRCSGASTTGYYDAGRGVSGTIAQLVGHPVIGKTGTSDFNWTANLVLSTKQLAVAGTLADPDRAQTPHNSEDVRKVNTAVVRLLRDAMKGKPKIQFLKPPNSLVFGKRVGIPNLRCRTINQAQRALSALGFDVVVELDSRNKIPSPCPKDTVAKTDPEGSTSKGSTVTLILSNGEPPSGGGPGGGGGGGGGGPGGGGGGGGIGPPPPNVGRPPTIVDLF
jgi:membrane peptidoglycan carboxypeptidase